MLENTGDLIIPEGTVIKWKFYTKDVDLVRMRFEDEMRSVVKKNSNTFEYERAFSKNQRYVIKAGNSFVSKPDSLVFTLTVIPDLIPSITVKQATDTLLPSRLYFQGIIKDDYGFSRLTFFYTVIQNEDTTKKEVRQENLSINKNLNQQPFYYSADLSQIAANPGDEIEYYFEVCDNDALHGGKCSRTGIYTYKALTPEEIEKLASQKEKSIETKLEMALSESRDVQKQIDDLTRKMTEKNTLTWEDKKQLEDLLQKEKNIKDMLEKIETENEQKNFFEEQYNQLDSSIFEKQKQLTELFNQVMDEETKKMIEDLKKLLENIDKDQVSKMLEKMKMSNKDMEKQIDRSLEMFKQIEFDKALTETIEKLNQLSEQQEKLADKTDDKASDAQKIKEDQIEIARKFDEIRKNIDELEEKNRDLEEPKQFPNTDEK